MTVGAVVFRDAVLRITGNFAVSDLRRVTAALDAVPPGDVTIDFSACSRMDTSVAVRIWSYAEKWRSLGYSVVFAGLTKNLQEVFARFDSIAGEPVPHLFRKTLRKTIENVGGRVIATLSTVSGLVSFTTDAFRALFSGKVRGAITAYYMEQAGVMAIPIIVTLNWLMGVVLGYQAGYQMSQFGGELYMPALLAYSICWEIGPMMTAVLVAGRSGSAFAAEIGTMKIRQEVDALDVMGVNLYGYLVTPKMIALFAVMPLLITAANFAGMAGGLAAGGFFLKMPADVYINEVRKALIPFDLYWGVVKSLFYSTIISVTGSYMGMRVRGGPASVGKATTSAVVVSIFLVILVDALLSLVFVHLRPGLSL